MKKGLLHPGCGAGSDEGLEGFTKVDVAGQFTDYKLALLSVQKKDGSTPRSKVTGRPFSVPFKKGIFVWCQRFSER